MSTSFNLYGHSSFFSYPSRSLWDDDLLERTAIALYRYRRPIQSQSVQIYDLPPWTVDRFFNWAEEFLDAAMPDGPAFQVDQTAAGKICHQLKNDAGTMYFELEDQRWPFVGWWYEQVACALLKEALD